MKNFYTLLLFLLATVSILAQAPEKMSYQAVLRDASNTLLTNQEVGMQISILQSTITGTTVYIETQTAATNINGLVSLVIGSGTSSDDFSAIDWSAGPYFIKTATDPSGGSSYSITGTSQIMSVPFAMYATTSGNAAPGPQGEPGVQGVAGAQGIQGAIGTTGTNGTNGAKGDVGAKGDTGVAGTQGIQGAIGSAGTNGTNGAKGDVGAKGEAGVAGTQGIQGAIGTTGTNGTNGAKGDVGAKGVTGVAGIQGIQGATGAAGTTGATGLQGASGASGLTTAVNAIAQIDGNITITTTDIPEGKKKYYTDALVSDNIDVAANTLKVDTDATSVNAAGALMDSELTDLAGIKAVTIASLQEKPAEGAFADGDKTKLDAIEASADVTDAANVAAAGALMDSELTDLAGIKAITISTLQVIPSEGAFVDGDKTKLDGIEALIVALENKVRALEEHTPIAEVGDFRAGGVVFWLDPADNRHGLVCAIEDQSAGIQWYNGSYITTGATGTAIGAGSANTTAIIASQGAPEVSYAAGLARAYGGGGFNDWFLPSKDALNQMYQNKATINSTATANSGSNLQTSVSYWSSTEYDVNYAFSHFFFIGSQGVLLKNATHNVRAVRAF